MSFQKIICVMLLSKFIINYSLNSQVAAQTCHHILDGDSNNSENRLSNNCDENGNLYGTNDIVEDVKSHEDLDLDLDSLTLQERKLLKDEFNRFVNGYTSEEQLAKLLLTILKTHNGTSNDRVQGNVLYFTPTSMDIDEMENSINKIENVETTSEVYINHIDLDLIIKETTHSNQDLLTKSPIESLIIHQECNNSRSDDRISNVIQKDQNYRQTNAYNETTCKSRQSAEIIKMSYTKNPAYPKKIHSSFVNCNVIPATTNSEAAVEKIKPNELVTVTNNNSVSMDTVNLIIDAIKALKVMKSADVSNSTDKSRESEADITLMRERERSDFAKLLTLLDVMTNLTDKSDDKNQLRDHHYGKALIHRSAPACPHTPNRPWSKHNPFLYAINYTGTFVTSCFVCGLEEHQIPSNTLCEDAFSDDASLHYHQNGFGKYCRYEDDTANYCVDKRDPHSVWGRWTGGCAVRRIDISGIYTQRTCRNRIMPTKGNHFASHRMAKLELVLHDVEDGCILSPSASLVPLSRSVSLYARFVACVCSDQWCNIGVSYFKISYQTYILFLLIFMTV